jgi:DNA-binding GntR family transcriptional regulator
MDEMVMIPLKPQQQLGERVHKALLDSIVNQVLAPGQHLVIDELATQIGTSGTPIREALNRLQQEGLVVKIPYQGWKVREFTINETKELYEVRAALESLAVKLCCKKPLSSATRDRLVTIQQEGTQAIKDDDLVRYRLHNDEFHNVILETAGNQTLRGMMNTLRHQITLFNVTTIGVPGRPPKAVREHATLIDYMVAGDVSAAVNLMEWHILSALEDLLKVNKGLQESERS